MSTELTGILAVGATLLIAHISLWRIMRSDISELVKEVRELAGKVGDLGERVAKIEGSLFHPPAGGGRAGPV